MTETTCTAETKIEVQIREALHGRGYITLEALKG
jgi:hypothetical protein